MSVGLKGLPLFEYADSDAHFLWIHKFQASRLMQYIRVNEGTICGKAGTLRLLFCCGDTDRIVTMLHSANPQGQFSPRKALTD